MNSFSACALVPVYNHPHFLRTLLSALHAHKLSVILVDDGSQADCADLLKALSAEFGTVLLRHEQNQGKGAAVMTGLRAAQAQGFSHALQIDADGQHQLADIPTLLAAACAHPHAVVTGQPQYSADAPKGRLYSRYITHVWVWIETLSLAIPDSMCGFRVYPVAACNTLMQRVQLGPRMAFDTEILVRLYWQGVHVISIPTPVHYHADGISHFRMLEDNLYLSATHARLFFGMLWRWPWLLGRRFLRRAQERA